MCPVCADKGDVAGDDGVVTTETGVVTMIITVLLAGSLKTRRAADFSTRPPNMIAVKPDRIAHLRRDQVIRKTSLPARTQRVATTRACRTGLHRDRGRPGRGMCRRRSEQVFASAGFLNGLNYQVDPKPLPHAGHHQAGLRGRLSWPKRAQPVLIALPEGERLAQYVRAHPRQR